MPDSLSDASLADDAGIVAALRAGDEAVFAALVDRYHGPLMRVARDYVATKEAAEDVVQETWLGVINGIDRFEARSSLKTWIFRILVNRAQSRGEREARTKPFSSFVGDADDPAVDPDRFVDSGRWAGFWKSPPSACSIPEDNVLVAETGALLMAAVEALPASQRAVIELHDIQGLSSAEVCELLSLSEGNQRVLLHRARTKVRAALEEYLDDRAGVS